MAAYFRENARDWSRIRRLHVDDDKLDAALLKVLGRESPGDLLDIGTGTGTGHVLTILA